MSRAASLSPLASTSADLHSIIPAPVSSRSLRTISAEMFISWRPLSLVRSPGAEAPGLAGLPARSRDPSGRANDRGPRNDRVRPARAYAVGGGGGVVGVA